MCFKAKFASKRLSPRRQNGLDVQLGHIDSVAVPGGHRGHRVSSPPGQYLHEASTELFGGQRCCSGVVVVVVTRGEGKKRKTNKRKQNVGRDKKTGKPN